MSAEIPRVVATGQVRLPPEHINLEAKLPGLDSRLAQLPPHLRKPRLRRTEASEYLLLMHGIEIAPTTLAKKATTGGGPAYNISVRTPLYPREELDRWAAERLGTLRTSTSDDGTNP